ncbi:hypothetical protein HDU79_011167 [Rhizoclosmatium sp. JEL0117]|nr:hypothetical protein HDU79_011167 [Rhizoclosmatium sp. JEL0117]
MSPNVGLVYQPPATARAPSMKPIATIVSDDSDDEFAANMEWAMTESMKLSGSVLLSDSTVTLDDDDDNVTRTDGQLPEIHISHQAYLDESFVIDDALQVCETIRVGEGKRLNGNFDPTVKRELKGAGRGLTSDEVVSLVHDLSEDNDPVKRSQFFVTPILQTNDQNKAIDCYSHVVAKEMQDFHETKFALPRLWTQTAKRHTTEKFKTEYFSKMEQMSLIVQGSLLAYALVHEKECSMFPNISEAVLLSLCGAPDTLFTKTMVYEMGFQNAFRRSETDELIMDYHSEVIELIDRYNELAGKEGFPIFKLPCEYEDVANLTTPKVFETFVILSECKWRRLLGLSYIKTGFIQWFPRHEVLLPLLSFIPNFFKTVHSFEDFRKQFKEPNGTDSEELRITFAAYMRLAKTWKPVFWTHVLRFVSGQMHIPVKTKISLNIVLNGGSGVYEARTCFAKLDLSPWKTEWNDVEQKTDEIMFWEALVTPSDDEAARNKELSFSSV